MRRRLILLIFLIAIGSGLYTQRVDILEWYRSVMTPELPEAVGYKDIRETRVIPTTDDGGGGISDEETQDPSSTPTLLVGTLTDDVGAEEAPQDDTGTEEDTQELIEVPLSEESIPESEPEAEAIVEELPAELNLAVPFTSQAPHGNWGEPYKEACEEASVYMVHAYYQGEPAGQIPADEADLELLKIVAFERELYGYYEDTNVEKTGVFAELLFGYTYRLIENPTVDDIKTELTAGRPVIVPAAGRLLGNPYFTPPGPIYHMLVIRGYTQNNEFIVNDPGTYRGEAYLYDVDTLMEAMHDWNEGEEITQGAKVVFVLNP